ncbi:hypothetical protein [Caulobacter sp. B11]|uniref:hypothetical protein n=1 Tax=Caulobacter sp. B11 TaxID=2048899 RepID=UPI00191BA2C9|nr:hypothetical protein [Caulobacter sp. B11]
MFSRYDEFSKLMWGVDRAQDVTGSAKLKAVFGATETIAPGKLYGDIAQARPGCCRPPPPPIPATTCRRPPSATRPTGSPAP